MDLPDCPPGAEGYEDSVVEVPKKPDADDASCTKAEQEFQDHLNSLKIKLENGETRCMVERRGRDISGKWIYLCYPCGSVCSGESILQTHISGKKHKNKLSLKTTWPMSIFDDHPFNQNQKGGNAGSTATEQVLQKMAAEVEMHKVEPSDLESEYKFYRTATCHIQDVLDALKAPLVGVEYLVEHPPEQEHYEPSYICTLCTKQGHPRTIVNHLTCFWHRYNYLMRHFPKACGRLAPYKNVQKYREGVSVTMHRLSQRIQDKFGRLRPVNIDKELYEKDKERILQWIFKGYHFSERSGITLEEVVDVDLLESLAKSNEENKKVVVPKKKDPSPPKVAAPSKPFGVRSERRERRMSLDAVSDASDDDARRNAPAKRFDRDRRDERKPRDEPAPERRKPQNYEMRRQMRNQLEGKREEKVSRPPNFEYKVKLAEEKRAAAAESAAQLLAYHEKNPEKHPLYPEEWKKFWNRRYKELQAEGKDPSKHDFKPEWIVFWTKRMKELHEAELQLQVTEIYRRMNIEPEDLVKQEPAKPEKYYAAERRRKSPEPRRRSPEPRRRSPDWGPARKRMSPDVRHERRRSPEHRRRSPERRRPDYRNDRRLPERYPMDHRQPETHHSPPRRTRSRSPIPRRRSPARTHIRLESVPRSRSPGARRSRSPLSLRESELRNRSPLSRREEDLPHRNRSPAHAHEVAPSMQTVMISDDELKPDDALSPWNSDNDIESIGSPSSRSASVAPSHVSSSRRAPSYAHAHSHAQAHAHAHDLGPPENIVATLRVLVALEDYLGSLGPKIVDLLTEALKMEKERANSSEELLERDSCVVLIETAKEKLKGAAQAGLVAPAAAPAVRAAVLRAAATLHEADTRTRKNNAKKPVVAKTSKPMSVAGVGDVDRAQIAQQMAAALIAQGKTDVTSEELAQLVDAVVGMAEAKKREAEATKKVESKPAPPAVQAQPLVKLSGTATALQMLQSAYDENDKKMDKEDAPDAMDGLSDSDLETLLKNFNELSAEEQHSLIAYLKKLEAREPQRVERLRQYVSTAATAAPPPPPAEPAQPAAPRAKLPNAVTIESDDDDDYTVEEVFQSATQKVKEDQIRKELDVVKKSLEGSKEDEKSAPPPSDKLAQTVDISKHLSSASDLFALVQASVKSTATISPAVNTHVADVVASSTQPRSFGDPPEEPREPSAKPQNAALSSTSATPINMDMQNEQNQPLQNQLTFNRNFQNEQFTQNESYNQDQQWNQRQMNDLPDNRTSFRDQGLNNFDQGGNSHFQDSGANQFSQGPNSGQNQFSHGSNSGPNQFGQGPNSGSNQFGQGSNMGPNKFGQGPNSGPNQFGQGSISGSNQFGQGTNPGPNQFGQGPNSGPNQFGQGPSSGPNQFGQGPSSGTNQFGQGLSSGPNQFGQGSNSGSNQFRQRSNSGSNQFGQGSNSGPNQFILGSNSGSNQFGQGNSGSNPGPNQFNQQPNSVSNQFGQVPNLGSNQFGPGMNKAWQEKPGQIPSLLAPNQYTQGQNSFNPGPRGSMNGRMGNNVEIRPHAFDNMNQQQFGKHNNNNARGRGGGRGNYGGGHRARGRGRF